MKKLATLVFAMLLTCSLSFAQTGGGSTDNKDQGTTETGKKGKSSKKAHKGGKKSKKSDKGADTTAAPK